MKNLMILTLLFLLGCATGVSGLLRFQDRELLVHPDKSGLGYPHYITVCKERRGVGRIFGKKCSKKHVIDFYDMNDKSVRQRLIDAGFTCKSKMRFKY